MQLTPSKSDSNTIFPSDDPIWSAMVSDPATAITVVTVDGQMVYCNPQWDRHICSAYPTHGPHLTGKNLSEVLPEAQAREHAELIHRSIEGKQPLLVRKLCGGRMYRTWMYPIGSTNLGSGMGSGMGASMTTDEKPAVVFVTRAEVIEEAPSDSLPTGAAAVEFRNGGLGPLAALSPRELEVLTLLADGMTIREIAAQLHRSEKTVDKHRTSIHTKLGIHDRVALCDIARRAGLRAWSLRHPPFQ